MLRDLAVWMFMWLRSLLMSVAAMGLAALGLTNAASDIDLMGNGTRLAGSVVEMVTSKPSVDAGASGKGESAKSTGCEPLAAPVVSYTDRTGALQRYSSTNFSCPAAYTVGQPVTVVVNPNNPAVARIEDELNGAMFWPLLLGGFTLLAGFLAFYWRPRREAVAKLIVDPPIGEEVELVALVDGRSQAGQMAPLTGIVASADLIREGKIPLDLCELCSYLAALAYQPITKAEVDKNKTSKKPQLTAVEHLSRLNGVSDVAVFSGGETEGFGFVLDGARFIILRGTTSRGDWKGNLDAALTVEFAPEGLKEPPLRHRGFAAAWDAIRRDVKSWVDKEPGLPIIVSGHSLGGALSFLGAWELATYGRDVRAVITFGAALPGKDEFAKAYADASGTNLGERTLRLEFTRDLVPEMQKLIGYVPVGRVWEPRQLPFTSLRGALAGMPVVWLADTMGKGLLPSSEKTDKSKASVATQPFSTRVRSWLRRLAVFGALTGKLALESHEMQNRYALALSILSYRKIRARALTATGGAGLDEGQLKACYEELCRHLLAIRGSSPEAPSPYDATRGLPRPVKSPGELRWYNAFLGARSW